MLEIGIDAIGQPGYLFVILFYSLWFFANAGSFLEKIKSINTYAIVGGCIVCSILSVIISYNSDYMLGMTVVRISCYLAGMMWLILLLRLGKRVRLYGWLSFLSVTSYELYLVHHIFCSGELSVLSLTRNPIVNYAILWIVTIILGWCLKNIGDAIHKKMKDFVLQ